MSYIDQIEIQYAEDGSIKSLSIPRMRFVHADAVAAAEAIKAKLSEPAPKPAGK